MHLTEEAYSMEPEALLREAGRQFAMAELALISDYAGLWERGGWFLLLVHAERAYVAPYCAKLAGPCPDDCIGLPVVCGKPGELHGDCWRVQAPMPDGVDSVCGGQQ